MNENLVLTHCEPCYRRQNSKQRQCHPKLPVHIGTGTFKALHLAVKFAPIQAHTGCDPSRIPTLNTWCTGEDSNLRSSKERQIYSLLPLTARPPVHNPPPRRNPAVRAQPNLILQPQKKPT